MAKAAQDQTVTVDGRLIKLTNLDKVLYPETGTTKADVIAYYAQVGAIDAAAPVRAPGHPQALAGRRRPGENGKPPTVFFNKDLATGTPDWVARHKIAHRDHDNYYPVVNDLATLTWLAQLAALEIHVPQWRFGRNGQPRNPDRLVLDLDPGPGREPGRVRRDRAAGPGHPARHRPRPGAGHQRAARASTCTRRWTGRSPPSRPATSPASSPGPWRPTTATG